MTSQKKVINFINHFTDNNKRKEVIECFSFGCCYWFAEILFRRFCNDYRCRIMYDPIMNHWGCEVDRVVYDITGNVNEKYKWVWWNNYAFEESYHAERLYRDCINFQEEEK